VYPSSFRVGVSGHFLLRSPFDTMSRRNCPAATIGAHAGDSTIIMTCLPSTAAMPSPPPFGPGMCVNFTPDWRAISSMAMALVVAGRSLCR
jgi:hypothetical protein